MKLKKEETGFTQVKNLVLTNPMLSLKAKGLYSYLFSKPNDWQFSAARIVRECQESRPTILGVLKELEEHCLLKRKKRQSGRVDYLLTHSTCEVPQSQESLPSAESKSLTLPRVKETHRGISLPISNKEGDSNTESAPLAQEVNFDLKAEVAKFKRDRQEHIRIIGVWIEAKELAPENAKQLNAVLKRNLIPARALCGYSLEDIRYVIGQLPKLEYLKKFTLETVGKYIDDMIVARKKKGPRIVRYEEVRTIVNGRPEVRIRPIYEAQRESG